MLTADEFSMEYEFDELGIPIGKVTVGCFSGVAYLHEDGTGSFYVYDIVLDGTRPELVNGEFSLSWRIPMAAKVSLRDSREDSAHFLRLELTRQIENSAHAEEAWAEAIAEREAA